MSPRPLASRLFLGAIAAVATVLLLAIAVFAVQRLPGPVTAIQSVGAAGPLRMEFPEPMDKASVEEALVLPGGIEGALSWDGNALLLTPQSPLERDDVYTLTVEKTARTASGDPLTRPLTFRFRITGNPVLSSRIPGTNTANVNPDTRITLVFDRPMIALAQVGKAGNPQGWEGVKVEPAIPGRWHWLSTYAVELIPERGLLASQLYTVTVPAGIRSVNNEVIEQSETWSFETERAEVASTNPEPGFALAGPTTPLSVTFTQEVDLRSISRHVELYRFGGSDRASAGTGASAVRGGQPVGVKNVAYGKSEDEKGELREDRKIVMITPERPLALGTNYALRVTPGVQAIGGGDLGSRKESVVSFATVGAFAVTSAELSDGNALVLKFSSPVSSGSLAGMIALDPEPEGWKETEFVPDYWDDNRSVMVYPAFKPGTPYTLTIKNTAKDVFGQTLAQPFTKNFTTPDLPASIEINSRGRFGIFERSKPPVFHVRSVNVKELTVRIAPLTLQQFLAFRNTEATNYSNDLHIESLPGVREWKISTKGVKNDWMSTSLELEELMKTSMPGGMYAMTVTAPEFVRTWDKVPDVAAQYFALTDTALTLKYSGDRALVWAVNMQTGAPIAGANVSFHNLNGQTPVTGRTDGNGFLDIAIPLKELAVGSQSWNWQPEFWVTAEKGNDFSFVSSSWTDPVLTGDMGVWWDFRSAEAPAFRPTTWIQTDRPVYRPGDSVEFKGITRLKDWNGQLNVPGGDQTMNVVIQSPDGTNVYDRTLSFSEFGSFYDTFPTTKDAPLGNYSFLVTVRPDGSTPGSQYAGSFNLLAYRKPEYRVELTPRTEEVSAGDTVTVDLLGSYYFGAPLAGAKVQWRAQSEDYFFNKVTDDWYAFAPEDAWCWWECGTNTEILTSGQGVLDDAGRLTITLPARIAEEKLSQILTIEADVTDLSSQVVSARTTVVVHKSQAYVGIRAEDYVVTPGSSATMRVITVDPQGKPLPGKSVTLTLSSRTWNTIRRKNVDGYYYYENEPKDEIVRTLTATTGADGKAAVEVPVEKGGQYVVTASVKDDRGRSAESSTSIYAWSSAYVNWPHNNTDRMDVLTDKPEYTVGDTAKLLFKSPFQGEGVQALVTVERENILTRKVIPVRSNAQSIEIPITENLIPNAYVSVVVIKPRQGETFDDNGLDTGAPAFKIGYAQLKIETARKELSLEIATDKERYLPGEQVKATITVKDYLGKPARTELSLSAVDASVLALTGYVRPDLVTTFYSQHGLGVNTAPMLQYLLERYKPGSKGGGGGLEDKVREDFKDTAFWKAAIVTNAQGKADVSFTLPDNLTTWQLLSVGSTVDSRFGATEKEVLATKKVILRPVRPRFAVTGDAITLKGIVHNFLPERHTFSVSLTGTGFAIQGSEKRSITLDADQQTAVEFPVKVTGSHAMTMRFTAQTDGARDEIVETIPTYGPGSPETVATWGSTDSMKKETVQVPAAADVAGGDLHVTLSPSMAAYLPGGLEHVTNFPYGCAEQTASAFLPNIAVDRLQGLDAFEVVDSVTLQKKVTEGLQTLYSFQRADGGFGYWQGSYQSSAPLTAYITYALHTAQTAGYAVDAAVIRRADDYLVTALRQTAPALDAPTRAYILYVLAETGRGDVNLALNLYEKRRELPVFARAQLAMALQKGGSASATRAATTLMNEIGNEILKDGRGAHVEERGILRYTPLMQTNERATAVALRAFIRIKPDDALLPDLVRWLLSARRDGHWDTTQSTSETILALTEYLEKTGELDADFTAGAEVNGEMKLTKDFDRSTIRDKAELKLLLEELKRGQGNDVIIGKDGTGTLYYDMLLTTVSSRLAQDAHEEGLSISRSIRPVSAEKDSQGISRAKLGDTYAVTLTITVPQERHAVAVESPLPAGMEAIDTSFQTSAQTGDVAAGEQDQQRRMWWLGEGNLWYFSHRELRDDRVFLFADELPAGTYRYTYFVRATTPGTYQMRPAKAWQMYQPEIFGSTPGELFTVSEQ